MRHRNDETNAVSTRFSTRRVTFAAALVAALVAGGCGGDDDSASDSDGGSGEVTTTTASAEETTTTEARAETLRILVSNDDGIAAEGIATVVDALQALPDTEVVVFAPADQKSGAGGSTTDGELTSTEATTRNGDPGTAVNGFPADSVNYAFAQPGFEAPHLVVTGINEGQNLAAFVELSGTVGAARAAVRQGVPALSSSASGGEVFDYKTAATYVISSVEEHREALVAGTAPVEVTNLNVPTCQTGTIRGEVTVETDYQTVDGVIATPDCSSTEEPGSLDAAAFNRGFVTWSVVSTEPVPNPINTPAG